MLVTARMKTVSKIAITGLLGFGACVQADDPTLGETQAASTVNDFGSSGGCSTAVVIGLSSQIADEIGCLYPGTITHFDTSANLVSTSNSVLQYLAADAASDLVAASQSGEIDLNSAFRTLAQQYLLVRWFDDGECGITAAASVGNSNHESFRAVDLANYSSRITVMKNHGWAHDVSGDPVHFDHLASPDVRSRDVRAFQTLWNLNNPNDIIGVDGDYGPQTEARLRKSPATGFPIGATCATAAHVEQAAIVAVDGPDLVGPGERAHYSITVQNQTSTDWTAAAMLTVANGTASPLYDTQTWVSPTEIGALNAAVTAGSQIVLDVEVTTPVVTEATPVSQQLELVDGGNVIGGLQIALTVMPGAGSGNTTSVDSTDTESATVSGGCSAGGGSAGIGMSLLALALIRRRQPKAN